MCRIRETSKWQAWLGRIQRVTRIERPEVVHVHSEKHYVLGACRQQIAVGKTVAVVELLPSRTPSFDRFVAKVGWHYTVNRKACELDDLELRGG